MDELADLYLQEIGRQISFVSAILAGFSATFLGTLMSRRHKKPIYFWTLGLLAFSACSFVLSLTSAQQLILQTHSEAPLSIKTTGTLYARVTSTLSFFLGLYTLVLAIGLSGFIKTKKFGWITLFIASITMVLLSLSLID